MDRIFGKPIRKFGLALFVTHDLSTVAYVGGEMMTIFQGGIVERVMTQPSHDYTRLLLASVPVPDPDQRWRDRVELVDGTPRVVAAAGVGTRS